MSVFISSVFVFGSFISDDRSITNGLAVGSLAGISFFVIAWWALGLLIRKRNDKKPGPFLFALVISVFIVKFLLLGIAFWYAFKHIALNPFSLVCGIATTQLAILIAGFGKLLNRQR